MPLIWADTLCTADTNDFTKCIFSSLYHFRSLLIASTTHICSEYHWTLEQNLWCLNLHHILWLDWLQFSCHLVHLPSCQNALYLTHKFHLNRWVFVNSPCRQYGGFDGSIILFSAFVRFLYLQNLLSLWDMKSVAPR